MIKPVIAMNTVVWVGQLLIEGSLHHKLYMATKTTKEDPRLISFQALRKTVGWLGISLPLAMILGNALIEQCYHIQDSISNYYYTVSGGLFVGILCAVGLFLIAYKGYEGDPDNFLTFLAGVFALCIALFPTNDDSANSCAIIHLPDSELRKTIHYASAVSFFTILAGISFFLFTKSKGQATTEKKIRNKVYRTCGVIIMIAMILIGIYEFSNGATGWNRYKPVFWLEWVALLAFGVSWLVKGEIVLKDHSLD